ncbi:hypothetical protein ACLOJK_008810 [Asimina triloba]
MGKKWSGVKLVVAHAQSQVECVRGGAVEAELEGKCGDGEDAIVGSIVNDVFTELAFVCVCEGLGRQDRGLTKGVHVEAKENREEQGGEGLEGGHVWLC